MNKPFARKITSVLLAGALILGGSIAMSASANAAGKQGTTCTKLKAKSGVYTCSKNPLVPTSTKLIWITANCISVQSAYLSSVADLNSYTKNATNSSNQSRSLLASYQNALTIATSGLDTLMNTKVYPIDYVPGSKPPTPSVTVIGYNNAVIAINAKIAADQTNQANYLAAVAKDVAGSTQAISDQKSADSFAAAIKSRQGTLALLTRSIATLQRQIGYDKTAIATWTSTVNSAIAAQKSLMAQLKAQVTSAKTTRKLACRAGL